MQNNIKTFVASASELLSSDLYMTIKANLFNSPEPNLNGVRCTEGFIDEIVDNQEKYIGLPLCADITKLVQGQYDRLGHCYDPRSNTFSSTMIGSFYRFEKVTDENGSTLVGYARVMKRNSKVCAALSELFATGSLKFSFEISCGSYQELDDDTILIDASADNFLEGMAVVSMPACPDAVALELVAEMLGKEADNMDESNKNVTEEVAEVKEAEQEVVETEVKAEVEEAACDCEKPVEEDAACKKECSEEENAACKKNAEEVEAAADPEEEKPMEDPGAPASEEEKKPEEEDASCGKKCAEEMVAELMKSIETIRAELESAKAEIASLKEEKKVVAEQKIDTINPFTDEIKIENKHYSLLDDVKVEHYSLLDPVSRF